MTPGNPDGHVLTFDALALRSPGGMDVLPAGNAPPFPADPSPHPCALPAIWRQVFAGRSLGCGAYGIKRVQHQARHPCAYGPGDPLSLRRCIIRHRPEAPETPGMREGLDGGRKNK